MEPLRAMLGNGNDTAHTFDDSALKNYEQAKVDALNKAPGERAEDDDYDCPICNNKCVVFYVTSDDGYYSHRARQCVCVPTRQTIKRMKRSGLENVIKDYTMDKYIVTEPWQAAVKDAAKKYVADRNGWFFIGGQSGAGKSHICTAICREFLLSGMAVAYMLWRDDSIMLKNAVTDAEQYAKLIERFKRVDVLYVDDLFKTGKSADNTRQKPTGADVSLAFEILNYRYNNPALLTIISSESTVDDILEIDEALGGRILERSVQFSLAPDSNKNYRLRKAGTE